MKIAIIGAGNLGISIAEGVLHTNGATTMYMTRRDLDSIQHYEKYGNVVVTTDNREAVKNSDILICCVQPAQFTNVLEEIKDLLHENHMILSTITGYSIQQIERVSSSHLSTTFDNVISPFQKLTELRFGKRRFD